MTLGRALYGNCTRNLAAPLEEVVFGAHIFRPSGTSTWGTDGWLYFRNVDSTHIRIQPSTDDMVVRNSAGTSLGSFTLSGLSTGTMHHVEVRVKIHETDGEVEVIANGVQVLDLSGINTKNPSAAAEVTNIHLRSVHSSGVYSGYPGIGLDNIYISTEFHGELKSHLILPTADDVVEFTRSGGATNYERLLTNDADTNYVESDVVGEQDLYEAGPDLGMFEIHGITFVAVARKTDAGARSLVHAVNYDGVEHDLDAFVLSETYPVLQTQLATYGLDPNGDPWNYLLVNGMNPGFKVA
jgi:hypothetical protein